MIFLFWFSLFILFFCYIGYGLLLAFIAAIRNFFHKSDNKKTNPELPAVTLVIAACNEELIIEQKIQNSLQLDYPSEKYLIIAVADGSTDNTAAIVKKFKGVQLLYQPGRAGKMAAIKRAMQQVSSPVVIFSDANSMLNKECIRNIVMHYTDEKVGAVSGEKKINFHSGQSAIGDGEGLYWKYESLMKKIDAGFYTVVGAAGELFSMRTELFTALPDNIILDDFLLSMNICLKGYKIEYEPQAYAIETASASLVQEEKRKIRISAGAYQSIPFLWKCLNVFKYPQMGFQYLFRRFFRWTICPLLIAGLFISNFLIVINQSGQLFYLLIFFIQMIFYSAAITGWLLAKQNKPASIFTIPFYFVFMNYCLVKGFFRYLTGKQTVLWEKSVRQAVE
jgi:cellulose synthase/poly-beta-1,6-N-acetylglucosamine synthase-like glycosyltransferase